MKRIKEQEYLRALKIVKDYKNQIISETKGLKAIDNNGIKIQDFMSFLENEKYGKEALEKVVISRLITILKVIDRLEENIHHINQIRKYDFMKYRNSGKITWEAFNKYKIQY